MVGERNGAKVVGEVVRATPHYGVLGAVVRAN